MLARIALRFLEDCGISPVLLYKDAEGDSVTIKANSDLKYVRKNHENGASCGTTLKLFARFPVSGSGKGACASYKEEPPPLPTPPKNRTSRNVRDIDAKAVSFAATSSSSSATFYSDAKRDFPTGDFIWQKGTCNLLIL